MKFGIALGRLHPRLHEEMVLLADDLGFESVWLPEHLVLPVDMAGSPFAAAEHPPIPADAPVVDCFGYLSYLAGRTTQIRLGTHVYLLGLRHPFVAARAVQTLDLVSQGRAEIGIGAGWLENEWRVTGLDPRTRGRRLDEALAVCKRLWSDDVIEHHGEFFDFEPVMFEPKPVQRPHPPILVGGESEAALRRAARDGDGWIGLAHDAESCAVPIGRLRELRAEYDRRTDDFEMVCLGRVNGRSDVERFAEAGITRLLVTPWDRSSEALDGVRRLADQIL
ncbi:MAG: LLM class F420-dependent oxidoreductase [Acidimicrobiia bacterium]|nr:LLM class F420-dependent oxidoreductase [Acidimicrobiia bacterium]